MTSFPSPADRDDVDMKHAKLPSDAWSYLLICDQVWAVLVLLRANFGQYGPGVLHVQRKMQVDVAECPWKNQLYLLVHAANSKVPRNWLFGSS